MEQIPEDVAGNTRTGQAILVEERPALEESNVSLTHASVTIEHEPGKLFYILKRLIDIILAIIGILVMLPVFLIIAVCIKLEDGGSILYFREIIGLHQERFFALKFRTMIPDADDYLRRHPELLREYQETMKLRYDPRVTRVGKFLRRTSLDEFPQLFNVLIGQMSLVGPRMIHPSELPRYGEYAQKRLSVKPGMTGLWQLYGRQHDSMEIRIALDMQYIDERSLLLDLSILLKTLKVLIIHTGV